MWGGGGSRERARGEGRGGGVGRSLASLSRLPLGDCDGGGSGRSRWAFVFMQVFTNPQGGPEERGRGGRKTVASSCAFFREKQSDQDRIRLTRVGQGKTGHFSLVCAEEREGGGGGDDAWTVRGRRRRGELM